MLIRKQNWEDQFIDWKWRDVRNLVNCSFQVGWLGGLSWHQIKCLSHTMYRILSNTWGVVKKTKHTSCPEIADDLVEGRDSLVAQMVKNPPAKKKKKNPPATRETGFNPWIGQIPWRKGIATHSSILACRMPWTEEPGGLRSIGSQRIRHNWPTKSSTRRRDAPL